MLRYQALRAMEDITDCEIASAIRYLDPDPRDPVKPRPVFVIVLALFVILIGGFAYMSLCQRLS